MRFDIKKVFILLGIFYILTGHSFAENHPKYSINCQLDTQGHTIYAKQIVEFTNKTNNNLDSIYFHIYPNKKYTEKEIDFFYKYAGYFKVNPFPGGFDPGGFDLESAECSGEKANYSIEGNDRTILKIELPEVLKPQDSIIIDLKYSVKIPHMYGRFGWHNDIIALNRWYPILSMLDEKGWHNYPFYAFHQPYFSESSYYEITLTLPEDNVVAHSGILKDEKKNNDNTKKLVLESELPIRDFSLAISPSFKQKSILIDETKITSYYLERDEKGADDALNSARDLLRYYGGQLGKYPYKEFCIAPVYLAYGGHEAANMIFVDTRFYRLPGFLSRYFDFLISHETGHQWFYNVIGSDEYKETFLDEGLNSYWIHRYLEDKYGVDAEVLNLPESIKWFIPNFKFKDSAVYRYIFMAKNSYDRPIIRDLSSFQELSSIFAITYGKGSGVLFMLESIVGKEVLDKIMKRYAQENKFKNSSLEGFIKICSEEGKKDLKPFFDQWLYGNDKCDYSIKDVLGNKIILKKKEKATVPIELNVEFQDKSVEKINWDGAEEEKEILLDKNKRIKKAWLDQGTLILDLDQTDNHWPRKLNKQFVPLYSFLYEIPVALPSDSYNILYGPSLDDGIGARISFQKPYDNMSYLTSGYDFSSRVWLSKLGASFNHILDKQIKLGFELFNKEDYDYDEKLTGGKVYLRKELWPVTYSLAQENDNVSLYLLRNRKFAQSSQDSLKEPTTFHYKVNDEAIIGASLEISRQAPYPDPIKGYKISASMENAGHFIGGDEAFWRNSISFSNINSFITGQKLAYRVKYGLGFPKDKYLYELGGPKGLRGYDRKDIQGSNSLLSSVEYRVSILDNLGVYAFDNIINFDDIQVVGFFDIGKGWFGNFDSYDFKKDAGFGLRLGVNLGSFLEKIILRFDTAWAIGDESEDGKFWFGLSHTF